MDLGMVGCAPLLIDLSKLGKDVRAPDGVAWLHPNNQPIDVVPLRQGKPAEIMGNQT
jgi:hypothetical protein